MKHIKQITEWTKYIKYDGPKKGDYVLLEFPTSYGYNQDFFDKNIGQIIKKRSGHDYVVRFDKSYDNYNNFETDIVGSDIKHWSKNKEDLEHIITGNKYNL
jgi:hypothetical protein